MNKKFQNYLKHLSNEMISLITTDNLIILKEMHIVFFESHLEKILIHPRHLLYSFFLFTYFANFKSFLIIYMIYDFCIHITVCLSRKFA